jgi:hypothetical protein
MNQGAYLFSQLTSIISPTSFRTCVKRYNGDYKTKHFTCWKQYLCMVFGQLTHRESLSDTILCLKANSNKLYHIGIGEAIAKSTLSTANENRDWRIFSDFAWVLIKEAKQSIEEFASTRLKGAEKIADTTLKAGGLSLLTYKHYKVKLPYYKKAAAGKLDKEAAKKEFEETLKSISLGMTQSQFQTEVGRLEVLGELLIENK